MTAYASRLESFSCADGDQFTIAPINISFDGKTVPGFIDERIDTSMPGMGRSAMRDTNHRSVGRRLAAAVIVGTVLIAMTAGIGAAVDAEETSEEYTSYEDSVETVSEQVSEDVSVATEVEHEEVAEPIVPDDIGDVVVDDVLDEPLFDGSSIL
ncbi:hypothetical protein EA473_04525 [Natrarchaeobius chitinivorans]|uniref:Uncharacterized protein n=2 Tax=Natrarchaeobius chitinivorans TaxID=1679083 RepID=A0A3N6LZP2_NATCH|nr:hypothetical protein EA473_04525 [Natrarchaeobius chitinivorans]